MSNKNKSSKTKLLYIDSVYYHKGDKVKLVTSVIEYLVEGEVYDLDHNIYHIDIITEFTIEDINEEHTILSNNGSKIMLENYIFATAVIAVNDIDVIKGIGVVDYLNHISVESEESDQESNIEDSEEDEESEELLDMFPDMHIIDLVDVLNNGNGFINLSERVYYRILYVSKILDSDKCVSITNDTKEHIIIRNDNVTIVSNRFEVSENNLIENGRATIETEYSIGMIDAFLEEFGRVNNIYDFDIVFKDAIGDAIIQ